MRACTWPRSKMRPGDAGRQRVGVGAAVAEAAGGARPRSPALPVKVTRGNRSAIATPTRAVAPASSRSAMRMSGRRRSRPAGSPTGTMPGSGGRFCGGASSARSAPGSRPTSTDRRWIERATAASSGAMVPSVARQLRLRARGVELGAAAGVEPHLREIERVDCWFATLRRATSSCCC